MNDQNWKEMLDKNAVFFSEFLTKRLHSFIFGRSYFVEALEKIASVLTHNVQPFLFCQGFSKGFCKIWAER